MWPRNFYSIDNLIRGDSNHANSQATALLSHQRQQRELHQQAAHQNLVHQQRLAASQTNVSTPPSQPFTPASQPSWDLFSQFLASAGHFPPGSLGPLPGQTPGD